MAQKNVQPLGQKTLHDGSVVASTRLTSVDDKTRGSMTVPPTTVVPVIFVPGIMGSNLRDKETKKSVWNTNSKISILLQWIFRSASTRQSKLKAKNAEVDPTGKWYGKSATVLDKEAGESRGQGTASRSFYGDFVRWLDDRLNEYQQNASGIAISPWKPCEGNDFTQDWHAEKPFHKMTRDDVISVWDHFFCPVHVQGYNWLQSNGESGRDLVEAIDEIIDYWQGESQSENGPVFECRQVILVSHSMGGLVTRAAVHPDFGAAADRVVGIVHGEQPSNGAAAAYHHCRSGYGGISGWVLGRNAAQVTAVFANSPGAMELLPNQQYPAGWLKAKVGDNTRAVIELPESDPYIEIYSKKNSWWRLTDPDLINPNEKVKDSWDAYLINVNSVSGFHYALGVIYHPWTYAHYGADAQKYPAFGDLVWHSKTGEEISMTELYEAKSTGGSNPVTVTAPFNGKELRFSIVDPGDVGYPQPGDGTVPACSGSAPYKQGGGNIKQSFRLTDFDHQAAYDNDTVRQSTLYAIGMLLQQVHES